MQVNETLNEGLTREFTITIPAADLDAELNSKLVELAPQVSLPGFRPGKVPPGLLRQRYGDALLGEVIEKSVNDSSQRALDERDLRPASQPNVEITSYEKGQDLEYKLSVELMPEIDTVDFSTLELERLVAEPGESDISDALAQGDVRQILPDHEGSSDVALYAVQLPQANPPLAITAFVDFLAAQYALAPPWESRTDRTGLP